MHFSLEQGWKWDTAPSSANDFAPGSHPSAIALYPGLLWRVCLQGFEAGLMRKGCTRRKKCRAGGLCHQEQWSVLFPPLAPPSAFTQDHSSQEGERAFSKYNYKTVGINTTRQMDSSAETDRLDGEIK